MFKAIIPKIISVPTELVQAKQSKAIRDLEEKKPNFQHLNWENQRTGNDGKLLRVPKSKTNQGSINI